MFLKLRFPIFSTIILLSAILTVCEETLLAQTNKLPPVDGKNFVSLKKNKTLSAKHINRRLKTVFGEAAFPETTKPVDLYKLSYRSLDENGSSVVLTGLLATPETEAPKGLVIFAHGTFADRDLSPSRYKGKATNSEAELAMLAFASGGYAVAMPDYLGLGDDKGFHPYPLGYVNSISAIDIIAPARTAAARRGVLIGKKLFVTGYSEGGAVAMWTIRALEKRSGAEYVVSAAAPISGPYDLSGTTRKWLLAPADNQENFAARLYLLSYMVYSFHKNRGVKLTNYLKPSMAFTVSQAFKKNRSDENIIKRLVLAAVLMRAKNSIENVISDRFKRALENLERSDPVIKELEKNDTFDWASQTKILLISLKNDSIVDPLNSEVAYEKMRNRAAKQNLIKKYVIKDENLTHLTAVPAALIRARLFFDSEFN